MAVHQTDLRIRDAEVAVEALDVLGDIHGAGRSLALASDPARFDLTFRGASAPEFGVNRLAATAVVEAPMSFPDRFVAVSGLSGHVRCSGAGVDLRLPAGGVAMYPIAGGQIRLLDASAEVVHLSMGTVRRLAGERTGLDEDALVFQQDRPLPAGDAAMWHALSAMVGRELLSVPDGPGALSEQAAGELLALTALSLFASNVPAVHQRDSAGAVGPASLRRAVDHIDEHAQEPLTMSDVAAAAGTTARAVQIAFRRAHGMSPMQYLRLVRLDHAHRQLRDVEPGRGHTVEAVARQWGFSNPARFARHYREVFGVLPSVTLHGRFERATGPAVAGGREQRRQALASRVR